MAKLQVELVTAEERVLSEEADFVIAPGIDGELGILPNHIALLTPLKEGQVTVKNDGKEHEIFVSGGFLEVLPDRVVILADDAARAHEVDESAAEAARQRAHELLQQQPENPEAAAMMESAMFQLRVTEIRRRRHGDRPGGTQPS